MEGYLNDSAGSNRMQYCSSWGPTVSCTSASFTKRAHVRSMAPTACNMVQVSDQRFSSLSAFSIKRAHVGNISRPSGHIQTALPFKEVPYSKSVIPMGRGPYPTLVPFERRDLN
ncbi:hypothetical protein ACH5RR_001804 [Cinchona calisaya]|uniref:Uncharacterized protein n=1 Tax=Cinchona calisaya TaxID=153742 RepID=A0ABD3B531_9GENT